MRPRTGSGYTLSFDGYRPTEYTLLFDQENSIVAKLLKLKDSSSVACVAREPKFRGDALFGM
jgi:hypothetical protein